MKKIAIFGAVSAIAQETAKLFAQKGDELYLLDLSIGRLEAVEKDIKTRFNNTIHIKEFNANNIEIHQAIFDSIVEEMNGLDAVLIAWGTLPNQKEIEHNISKLVSEFTTNGLSVIAMASVAANYFEQQNYGTLAVISSVAGDRGRQSNYVYGAAKGTISLFMQGLRNRFGKTDIKIITIKPGMVDTPMTADMPKNPLYSTPITIGKGIFEAMVNGKEIAYLPTYWRLVMFIIKHIPEFVFKKLSL
jgi:decaprenylphospho-beta-D-erythro-pentofuranosid-2-ulose 2-reductase